MAFEKRGNNLYFYRKERPVGRVRSVYVGRSETAFLIAELDRIEQLKKELDKEKALRQREETVDASINALSAINKTLVECLFLACGYHQNRRQWRKKRMSKQTNEKIDEIKALVKRTDKENPKPEDVRALR